MKIAVEGCAHGELETIYDTIQSLEEREGFKVDLLICCGDFQASRNNEDLCCMAIPPKYYNLCSFYKYYTGEKLAPILTIFIGGNHESSNYLQELPYGGWVAPNIYYLGYAGVINIAGIRIGGISGIYKSKDYMKGHFEKAPYNEDSKRSVYHVRNLEVFRLKQLSGKIDVFVSHDWPATITNYGNREQLIRFKPHFKDDINSGQLGSKPCDELLDTLQPSYWFAAHLHCKFAALVPHNEEKCTKFLALDKCLPKRRFLQTFDFPHDPDAPIEISYDLEWLTILFLTNHLLSVKNVANYLPGPGGKERYQFTPSEEEKSLILRKFGGDLKVPLNFEQTASGPSSSSNNRCQPCAVENPQTIIFCEKLGVDDPLALLMELAGTSLDKFASFERSASENSQDGLDEATFIESDLEASEVGECSPQVKRTSLVLPEPKNVSHVEEPASTVESEMGTDEGIIVYVNAEDSSAGATTETPVKKLKRRNADIYRTEDT